MAGLIEHHRKELERLAVDLCRLDATIKLFTLEINLRALRAKSFFSTHAGERKAGFVGQVAALSLPDASFVR